MNAGRRQRRTIRKDVYFALIPEWVLFHEDLKPIDVRLFGILERYSEGNAFPGRKLLASKLGRSSLTTVDTALARLESVGAITVIERYDDNGDRTSNLYEVHMTPDQGVAQEIDPPPSTDWSGGGSENWATGGPENCAPERATFSTTPLTPASGGAENDNEPTPPALAAVPDACPKHGTTQAANCRGCGTTVRQVQIARRQAEALQRRDDAIATAAAERAAGEARRLPPEHNSARARQIREQHLRSN